MNYDNVKAPSASMVITRRGIANSSFVRSIVQVGKMPLRGWYVYSKIEHLQKQKDSTMAGLPIRDPALNDWLPEGVSDQRLRTELEVAQSVLVEMPRAIEAVSEAVLTLDETWSARLDSVRLRSDRKTSHPRSPYSTLLDARSHMLRYRVLCEMEHQEKEQESTLGHALTAERSLTRSTKQNVMTILNRNSFYAMELVGRVWLELPKEASLDIYQRIAPSRGEPKDGKACDNVKNTLLLEMFDRMQQQLVASQDAIAGEYRVHEVRERNKYDEKYLGSIFFVRPTPAQTAAVIKAVDAFLPPDEFIAEPDEPIAEMKNQQRNRELRKRAAAKELERVKRLMTPATFNEMVARVVRGRPRALRSLYHRGWDWRRGLSRFEDLWIPRFKVPYTNTGDSSDTLIDFPPKITDMNIHELKEAIRRKLERQRRFGRRRHSRGSVRIVVDGVALRPLDDEQPCRLTLKQGARVVKIVGIDDEPDPITLAAYVLTHDGPKSEHWNIDLSDRTFSCDFHYHEDETVAASFSVQPRTSAAVVAPKAFRHNDAPAQPRNARGRRPVQCQSRVAGANPSSFLYVIDGSGSMAGRPKITTNEHNPIDMMRSSVSIGATNDALTPPSHERVVIGPISDGRRPRQVIDGERRGARSWKAKGLAAASMAAAVLVVAVGLLLLARRPWRESLDPIPARPLSNMQRLMYLEDSHPDLVLRNDSHAEAQPSQGSIIFDPAEVDATRIPTLNQVGVTDDQPARLEADAVVFSVLNIDPAAPPSAQAPFTASGRAPGDSSKMSTNGAVLENSDVPISGVTVHAVLANVVQSKCGAAAGGSVSNTVALVDPTSSIKAAREFHSLALLQEGRMLVASGMKGSPPTADPSEKNVFDTYSIKDLDVPVSGLPVQLIRTYDSRNAAVGDFGRPWTLDIRNIRPRDNALDVTTRAYDASDNVMNQTNPSEQARTYSHDANRNPLTETDPLGKTTGYTYGASGEVLTITDPLGRVTTNVYDGKGNLTWTTDPLGHVTRHVYNTRGLRTATTDPLGNVTSFKYDAFGNLVEQTDPMENVTIYAYDSNGNCLSETKKQTSGTTVRTLVTSYEYDAVNRLTKTTFPDGTTTRIEYNTIGKQAATFDQLSRKTQYKYDAMGRLTKTTFPDGTSDSSSYDAEGRPVSSSDRRGRVTSFTYDPLGRLTKTTFVDNTFTTTEFDAAGQVSKSTDERGNATSYAYDAAGRLTSVTGALGHVTTFTYDSAGNQVSVKDANGNTTQYKYDAANRRVKTIYPDTTSEAAAYDALGRTISKTDQAGVTTQFEYDKLGRLMAVVDALNQRTSYTYDELGNRTSQTDANNHTTTFEFDVMGRRVRRTQPLGMSETFTYDPVGNVATTTDFNGKTTTYAYDAGNRLLSKSPDPTLNELVTQFSYSDTGQRTQMVDASGTVTYTYDNRDRLTNKATPDDTLTFTYDAAGNLASMRSSNVGGTSVDYAYDTLSLLSTVTGNWLTPGGTNSAYDTVGNLAGYTYPRGVPVFERDGQGRITKATDSIAEFYDPTTSTWTTVASMVSAGQTCCNGSVRPYLAPLSGGSTLAAGSLSRPDRSSIAQERTVTGPIFTPNSVQLRSGQTLAMAAKGQFTDGPSQLLLPIWVGSTANTVFDTRLPVRKGPNQTTVESCGEPGTSLAIQTLGNETLPTTIIATQDPSPDANGWNNTNVTVTFTCSDAGSGIATCPAPVTVNTAGANQLISGTAVDNAGNRATTSVALNIDKTFPIVSVMQSPNRNVNGWNNGPVTVTFTAADALPGVAPATPTGPVSLSTGSNLYASGQATDLAGNTGSVSRGGINIDTAAPAITAAVSPPANADGWNNTAVTVHFDCSDSGSGIADCPADQAISIDGVNQTLTGTAADRARNTTSITSASVNLDQGKPTNNVSLSPTPNANGWDKDPVVAQFTCSDAGSGIASCRAHQTINTVGANQAVSGTVIDSASNKASATSLPFNIDQTAPTISVSLSPAPDAHGWSNEPVAAHFTCADSGSGITTCRPEQPISSGDARQPVSGTATDKAGNSASLVDARRFRSGSDGSDGAYAPSGPPGAVISFDPRLFQGTQVSSNIFNFTTITIPVGVTVKLSDDVIKGPVIWLAQGDVNIQGTIDLSGESGHDYTQSPFSRVPSVPGAGGYAGGVGGSLTQLALPGAGPRGGSVAPKSQCGGRFGLLGGAGTFSGNQFLIPLVGGSGGGGSQRCGDRGFNPGGGAGGGALLIASSSQILIDGQINANGGGSSSLCSPPRCQPGGSGSGGAIRFVSNTISGSGVLTARGGIVSGAEAGSPGRIRLEAYAIPFRGTLSGTISRSVPFPLLISTAGQASVKVISINGVDVNPNPSTFPDITINTTSPVPVVIQTHNIPKTATTHLTVLNQNGVPDTIIQAPALDNCDQNDVCTTTVNVVFPLGASRGLTKVTWTP